MSEMQDRSRQLSRRQFLRVSFTVAGATTAAGILGACATQPTQVPVPTKAEAAATPIPVPTQPPAATPIPAPTQAPAAASTPVLQLWYDTWGPQEMWDTMFSEAEELAKVKLETSIVPWDDHETKVLTALAGGMVIDVLFSFAGVRGTFAKEGVTMPLDPLIKAESYDIGKFFAGGVGVFTFLGEIHGLPIDYQAMLYFYNRALFQEAGLTEPYDLWKEGKWTFDTFVDYAEKLSKGEGNDRQFGAAEFPKTLRIHNPAIKGFGGRIWNEDFTKVELNSPEALKAWDFLADHVRKGWSPTTAGRDSDYQKTMMGLFNSGRLAMLQQIRVFLGTVDPALTLDMVEMPIWPVTGKAGGRSSSNGFGIGKATSYPAQAWTVLKHLAERGGQLLAYNEAGGPNTYEVFNSPEWRALLRPTERVDIYEASLTNGVPDDLPPGFDEMDKIAMAAYDEIALGLKSSKEAMDAAAADIQQVLDEQQ